MPVGVRADVHFTAETGLEVTAGTGLDCKATASVSANGMAGPIPVTAGIEGELKAFAGLGGKLTTGGSLRVDAGASTVGVPPLLVWVPSVNFSRPAFTLRTETFAQASASLGLGIKLGVGNDYISSATLKFGGSTDFSAQPGACSWDAKLGQFSAGGKVLNWTIESPKTPPLFSQNLWNDPCGGGSGGGAQNGGGGGGGAGGGGGGEPPPAAKLSEFAIPSANSGAQDIASGSDGALWFTELNANKIGRISVTGDVREYDIPTPSSEPASIAAGPDGALWFTESAANKIGRITTSGTITEFDVPTPASTPWQITAGADGAMWFTERAGRKIGRISTGGSIVEFTTDNGMGDPVAIARGEDDAIWFTQASVGYVIGRMEPDGLVTRFFPPTPGPGYLLDLALGSDGALWFTETHHGKIGRITSAGVATEYPLSSSASQPVSITSGPDNALWFATNTTATTSAVGRISVSGAVSEFPLPYSGSKLAGITSGADSALWIVDTGANRIRRLVP